MIHYAITHIVEELNNYFKIKYGVNNRILPAGLVQQDGQPSSGSDGRVILSVVNVEEDRLSRSPDTQRQQLNGTYQNVKPEIKLNLYLLFSAYFSTDYNEALKSISGVISFFQRKNFIDRTNTPDLNPHIDRMVFELYSLTLEQQNHLWGSLGAKYMPSVLYKMRILSIQEEEIESMAYPVREIDLTGKNKNT
jgi:hypothetical protein